MMSAALILAGSRLGRPDPVALAEGVAHKALAEVGGEPILARVIAAVRASGIARVAVVANDPAVVSLAEGLGAEVLPPAAGPSASVAAAFARLGAPLLVTTADHALLRPEWLRDFVADVPADADVALLLARREAVEAAMPGSRRTWLKFADGHWSGCNLFLLKTPAAAAARLKGDNSPCVCFTAACSAAESTRTMIGCWKKQHGCRRGLRLFAAGPAKWPLQPGWRRSVEALKSAARHFWPLYVENKLN